MRCKSFWISEMRNAKRKDELWDAILKSEKSYEEIFEFIRADAVRQEE